MVHGSHKTGDQIQQPHYIWSGYHVNKNVDSNEGIGICHLEPLVSQRPERVRQNAPDSK